MPLIEVGGVKGKYFTRNTYIRVDDNFSTKLEDFIHDCNNTDAYTSIYTYEGEDPDEVDRCGLLGPFYLDFDSDTSSAGAFASLKRQVLQTMMFFRDEFGVPFEVQRLYFSGHKGFHLLIPHEVFGISYQTDLNVKYKKLMLLVDKMNYCPDLDHAIYDRRRLFRIPGTKNAKGGLYKTRMTFEQLQDYSMDDIRELASEYHDDPIDRVEKIQKAAFLFEGLFKETAKDRVRKRKRLQEEKQKAKHKLDITDDGTQKPKVYDLSPCVQEILSTGTTEGYRNVTCVVLANTLFQTGREYDEVQDMVEDWNTLNDPPITDTELIRTVGSAYSMFNNGKKYGQEKLADLGYCIGTKCPKYRNCQKNKL